MKAGDHITIHSARSFADGVIAAICDVDDLPHAEGAPNVEEVRAALTGGMFTRVALIEYELLDQTLAFTAFEDTHGNWWDLRGRQITIEPRTASNQARELFDTGARRRKPSQYPD